MRWIKLTLLEAGFLRDVIEEVELGWHTEDNIKTALELLDGALNNPFEEEIDE